MQLWRISEFETLDGGGGLRAPGRWHHEGTPIVYFADTSALALLETLVRINRARLPESYKLLQVEVPDDLEVTLWPDEQQILDKNLTRDWGDAYLKAAVTPLARVPSSVAPCAHNYLLNPAHPKAEVVRIAAARRWPWDARLFGQQQAR